MRNPNRTLVLLAALVVASACKPEEEDVGSLDLSFPQAIDDAMWANPEVQPLLTQAPKILSLRDPDQKMSKSAGEGHYLSLDGSEKEIRRPWRS